MLSPPPVILSLPVDKCEYLINFHSAASAGVIKEGSYHPVPVTIKTSNSHIVAKY